MEAAQEIFDVVRAGDVSRLQALLATNPGLANVRNDRGHSPVLIAQYHRRPEAVAALLAAGPDLDIFDAASVGRTERVAELLDRDPSLVNAYSSDGFYPLGLAAFFAHPDTVRLLLSRGADGAQVARNPMKVQPLHAAAAFMVSYFVKGPVRLRRVQGVAAGLWALYGVLIHSMPVIVANILVASVAIASSVKFRAQETAP